MKRLFSPWRSAYIQSFQGGKKNKGCIFCRIAKEDNDENNLVIWRGKKCFVLLNKYPYNNGHLMIVPYIHASAMDKLSDETNIEIMKTVVRCMQVLKKTSKPDGFNFGANIGKEAGAGVAEHIHFHLVPRWNGDTNFFPVLADVKVVSEDMHNSWRKLVSFFNKNSKKEK
ncbi:MAG: HIT domain-containing protein [Bacteroidetes bacterium]|nr:HIT domain-containing protein [Bacteroidota bacterium]